MLTPDRLIFNTLPPPPYCTAFPPHRKGGEGGWKKARVNHSNLQLSGDIFINSGAELLPLFGKGGRERGDVGSEANCQILWACECRKFLFISCLETNGFHGFHTMVISHGLSGDFLSSCIQLIETRRRKTNTKSAQLNSFSLKR